MKRIGVVGTLLLALVVLAGCAAPQTRYSSIERSRFGLDSTDAQVGRLRLLSVSIASPGSRGSFHLAGDSAALLMTIANDGRTGDVLTGADADSAERIVLRNGDGRAHPHLAVAVPSGGVAVLREVSGPHLELSGLREDLRSGFSVPVTLRFRDAGLITLRVPIRTHTDVPDDRVPPPLGAAVGTG